MGTLWCVVLFSILHVITVNSAVQAQVKVNEPPRVVIAKGSGEIFIEKGKREYKPKFTEVDISKYAAGAIYAELKLSSGGCNAKLITTPIPTEDGRNNSGYFTVAAGKSETGKLTGLNITDGLISYFDRTISKSNKSSKFYVSVDFPMKGIGLWYAKDCTGTYEITVYVMYGKKVCGTLPPIPSELSRKLAEANRLTKYSERAKLYHQIHEELQKRGVGVGFFEAASTVTDNFSDDHWGFEKKSQDFLDNLSKELAGINAKYAYELLQTGKLEKENKSGYFSDPTAIDNELIRREQVVAENKLLSLSEGREIIASINDRTNSWLTRNVGGILFSSASATNEVRNRKRKRNPNAEFDYGDIKDRTSVGEILATKYRNSNLANAILCR